MGIKNIFEVISDVDFVQMEKAEISPFPSKSPIKVGYPAIGERGLITTKVIGKIRNGAKVRKAGSCQTDG